VAVQIALVYEVCGNPFRPVTEPPGLLPGDLVRRLALAAYEGRSPSGALDSAHLAVLSDAVEEGGFADAELLAHLRSPGPHVLGCWAVEGMLNRVEAGIRAFDPCLSCSTHALGRMPLHVQLLGADGALLDGVRRSGP
jgi:hypothetical protein